MDKIYVILQNLFNDRVFRTSALALLLILPFAISHQSTKKGMYPNEYWARKADWYHCADVVLAGDSRVSCGLSPKEMQKYMHGYKILNYGFGGAWFSPTYMDKIETVLNPDSCKKMIITGISPHSLTKRKPGTDNFFEVITMSKSEKFFKKHFAKYVNFFEPLSINDLIKQMSISKDELDNRGAYYQDGWTSGNKSIGNIERVVKKYEGYYRERLVDPCNIENLINYVKKWVSEGITVYGFFPPSCKQMYELEMEVSGINEQELIRKFEEAGGLWVDIDPVGYVSFDGTHLQRDSALELSECLARKIAKFLKKEIGYPNSIVD